MKEVQPTKVTSLKAISKNRENKEIVRILHLGLFDESVNPEDVIDGIRSSESLRLKIMTLQSWQNEDLDFLIEKIELYDGVFYESKEEFISHLSNGLYYHDVRMGYNLMKNERNEI